MSYNIDMIRRLDLLEAPETVTTDWSSPIFSLDNRFGPLSISVRYEGGTGADMNVYVQMSNTDDPADFASITETQVPINDASGNIVYDLNGTGVQFCRIFVQVNAGTIDVTQIRYIGQQAH
jgi:hypothetical protein